MPGYIESKAGADEKSICVSVVCGCQSSYDAFVFILTESFIWNVPLLNSNSRAILFLFDEKGSKLHRNNVLSGSVSNFTDEFLETAE